MCSLLWSKIKWKLNKNKCLKMVIVATVVLILVYEALLWARYRVYNRGLDCFESIEGESMVMHGIVWWFFFNLFSWRQEKKDFKKGESSSRIKWVLVGTVVIKMPTKKSHPMKVRKVWYQYRYIPVLLTAAGTGTTKIHNQYCKYCNTNQQLKNLGSIIICMITVQYFAWIHILYLWIILTIPYLLVFTFMQLQKRV